MRKVSKLCKHDEGCSVHKTFPQKKNPFCFALLSEIYLFIEIEPSEMQDGLADGIVTYTGNDRIFRRYLQVLVILSFAFPPSG